MQTKIVYVVVADKDSIYLEQAYVSVWSLKYYNPDASVPLSWITAQKSIGTCADMMN